MAGAEAPLAASISEVSSPKCPLQQKRGQVLPALPWAARRRCRLGCWAGGRGRRLVSTPSAIPPGQHLVANPLGHN